MTRYITIRDVDAWRHLRAASAQHDVTRSSVETEVGDGELIDFQPIDELRNQLLDLKSEFPEALTSRDADGGRFEQRGCELVHRQLGQLPRLALSDPEFWTWLAIAKFRDIIDWRFAVRSGHAKFENYGVGKPSENMLFRMWLRGEIGYDPDSEDPYELARAGDQDLWRSHIIRPGYGNVRPIARALLRLQAGKLNPPSLQRDGIRSLAKELSRLRANIYFEQLPPERADALIVELAELVAKE